MIVRHSTADDINAIIDLLKKSLGDSLMPKSEAFWHWKHIQNPFGESPVLLAFEGDELVGVRAFMHWQWQQEDHVYKAVRAVDTATHPSYQGKGIFKKLTLRLVENCKDAGIDFIFNTPNKNSMPGYLKMGWRNMGRLEMHLYPVINVRAQRADFSVKYAWKNGFDFTPFQPQRPRLLTTLHRAGYFNWRYGKNPNIRYNLLFGDSYFAVFRLKQHKWGIEFRICDVMIKNDSSIKMLRRHLKEAAKDSGARLVTGAGNLAAKLLWTPAFRLGPQVTIRYLSDFENYLSFPNWQPSVGDMEVF